MADSSTQSIIIGAAPDRVTAVICDFARYPEWTEAVRRAEVVEEYEDGYASQVRFTIDAGVMADEYVLASSTATLTRTEDPDGSTTVTYTLEVDLSVGMLGMFRRKAEKMIMDTALKQLKRRVEATGAAQ